MCKAVRSLFVNCAYNSRSMSIHTIADKVYRGERLSLRGGCRALSLERTLSCSAGWPNHVRERLNGNLGYYNVNRHINYTNVCVIDCQLCQGAYARKPGQEGGYSMAARAGI